MRALALPLALAGFLTLGACPAAADCPSGMREFVGTVTRVDGGKLSVDSRFGDGLRFARAPGARVVGRRGWGDIQPGDLVSVCWKFDDKPRAAYVVTVR
jgi:hypothetical protein